MDQLSGVPHWSPCVLGPVSHNSWVHILQILKPVCLEPVSAEREASTLRSLHTTTKRGPHSLQAPFIAAPTHHNWGKPMHSNEDAKKYIDDFWKKDCFSLTVPEGRSLLRSRLKFWTLFHLRDNKPRAVGVRLKEKAGGRVEKAQRTIKGHSPSAHSFSSVT